MFKVTQMSGNGNEPPPKGTRDSEPAPEEKAPAPEDKPAK